MSRFIVYQNSTGQYIFTLKDADGDAIFTSSAYDKKEDVMSTINIIIEKASTAEVIDITA